MKAKEESEVTEKDQLLQRDQSKEPPATSMSGNLSPDASNIVKDVLDMEEGILASSGSPAVEGFGKNDVEEDFDRSYHTLKATDTALNSAPLSDAAPASGGDFAVEQSQSQSNHADENIYTSPRPGTSFNSSPGRCDQVMTNTISNEDDKTHHETLTTTIEVEDTRAVTADYINSSNQVRDQDLGVKDNDENDQGNHHNDRFPLQPISSSKKFKFSKKKKVRPPFQVLCVCTVRVLINSTYVNQK